MRMVDIIAKKRDGNTLSREEIHFFIEGYVKGEIPDYQASALAMAILFRGMTNEEIAILTDEMQHSGEVMDLSTIKGVKVDKHSTGGVGDKTSLVLCPMVAACGAKVAKMSGRGLGHTGGTLDKLESIPGLSVQESDEEFIRQVNKVGLAIIGQTQDLVPADKKLYALRDVTATVDSIPLIASSVMSKKLASGSDTILLDVTFGEGAFMKDIDSARDLARIMVDIGNSLGRNTQAVLSDMNEPLGCAVGNALEVEEAISALHGNGPKDLMELCYTCGSIMLTQAGLAKTEQDARGQLERAVKSGQAFKCFINMVEQEGGDISYLLNPSEFKKADHIVDVISSKEGFISRINALEIGEASMRLGAGRETLDDVIDPSAGIILHKKVGDYIHFGDVLCEIHTCKDESEYKPVIEQIRHAYEYVDVPVNVHPVVWEVVK
ncbi:MAG: pyrimidine-nucleoside phosphorylase [Coprobacillus sp.]|nr:pyrimidine-nucleoside phosphorylase [Coprobacillus sp.]